MSATVTFAGVPAVLDYDRTIERFVAQRWPASRWPFAQSRNDKPVTANPFQGHETLNRFRLPYPDVPAPRINEVIIPTGASRYGRGLFLFDRAGMEQIAASVFGFAGSLESLPDEWGTSNNEADLIIQEDSTNSLLTRPMRALPPTLIDATGANQLWLLPLVDFRYELQIMPILFTLDQDDTWQELLSSLESRAGLVASARFIIPPIDPAHGVPDRETFSDPGLSVGVAIDAAMLSLGFRIISTTLGGLVPRKPDDVEVGPDAESVIWAGGNTPQRTLPGRINLVTRVSVDHFGQCGESLQIFSPIDGTNNDSEITIHTPWFREFQRERQSDDVAAPLVFSANAETLALLARIKADIVAWGSVQFEYSMPSIQGFEAGGHMDYFSIRVGGVDNLDSVSTHVRSLPVDFAPLVHLGQRPNIYVHPNETAQFTTLEAKPDSNNWVTSRIVKMDGFYSGSDIRDTLIFVSVNVCAPQLKANTLVMAHYQCEQGWFTNLGMEVLPAWEVTATLNDVLKYTDATGVATLISIRSNYPHIGPPPLVSEDGEIEFQNPWKLDGLCDSKVVLQFIDGKCKGAPCDATCRVNYTTGGGWAYDLVYTCPAGCDCPPLPTDTPSEATSRDLPCIPQDATSKWEIRQVENRRARWIKFQFLVETPSDITIDDYWDGEDPEACGQDVDVDYPLGQPCVDSDVVACYDPKTYRYKAITSPSAMLGPPEEMDIVQALAFDGCGINYIYQSAKVFPCGSEPDLINTEPDLVSVEVLNSASLLPPIAACANVCRYEWNGATWVQTETCESGSGCTCASRILDPPADPIFPGPDWVQEFPCDRDDGLTPRTGSLDFGSTNILVCSYTSGSGYSIPLKTCPLPDEEGY